MSVHGYCSGYSAPARCLPQSLTIPPPLAPPILSLISSFPTSHWISSQVSHHLPVACVSHPRVRSLPFQLLMCSVPKAPIILRALTPHIPESDLFVPNFPPDLLPSLPPSCRRLRLPPPSPISSLPTCHRISSPSHLPFHCRLRIPPPSPISSFITSHSISSTASHHPPAACAERFVLLTSAALC